MLETIREHALDRLAESGEEARVRRRHASYYFDLVVTPLPPPDMNGPRRIHADYPNVRAALAWFADQGDPIESLRFAQRMWPTWYRIGLHREGIDWLTGAVDRACDAPPHLRARALSALALLVRDTGDAERALAVAIAAAELADRAGDAEAAASARFVQGTAYVWQRDDLNRAIVCLREAVTLSEGLAQSSSAWIWWHSLREFGCVLAQCGELEHGLTLIDESVTLAGDAGDDYAAGVGLYTLAMFAHAAADPIRAATRSAESLAALARGRDGQSIRFPFATLAALAADVGRAEQAARLIGMVAGVRDRTGMPLRPVWQAAHDRAVQTARAALGEERFAASVSVGRRLPLADAVAEASAAADLLAGRAAADPRLAAAGSIGNARLSPRQLDILRLVAAGKSNVEIADALFVSNRTVTTQGNRLGDPPRSCLTQIRRGMPAGPRTAPSIAYSVRHPLRAFAP
jgi:non-specific serine/threonine protein kinase